MNWDLLIFWKKDEEVFQEKTNRLQKHTVPRGISALLRENLELLLEKLYILCRIFFLSFKENLQIFFEFSLLFLSFPFLLQKIFLSFVKKNFLWAVFTPSISIYSALLPHRLCYEENLQIFCLDWKVFFWIFLKKNQLHEKILLVFSKKPLCSSTCISKTIHKQNSSIPASIAAVSELHCSMKKMFKVL